MMESSVIDSLDDALEILKILLQGEEIGKGRNTLLYERYRHSSDVEEMLLHVAAKLELRVYSGNDRLFVCPESGSRLFGWSNEELRDRISYISNNSELFTGYFVIMVLVTMFYREAYPDTPVAYVKINELVDTVSGRFETLLLREDIDAAGKQYQFDFAEIGKVWQRLPDAREGVAGGKKDKVAFVENICKFLQSEKLIVMDMNQRILYPTDRFKTIIWNYYEDRENRKDLLSFVRSLEGGN